MKAKVLITFSDNKEKKIRYEGEIIELSDERFAEINSINDKLLEETEDTGEGDKDEYPKHIGGGYYELSNGDKIKGKENAIEAEEQLKEQE